MKKFLGKIIIVEHENNLWHPFIILWESKSKTIGLQCSSVQYDCDMNQYSYFFSKHYIDKIKCEPDIIELDIDDGLKFHSQVDLNNIYIFEKRALKLNNVKNELNFDTYVLLLEKLKNKTFNKKEVNEMIEAAYNNSINYIKTC
ncbi:hypothetical protein [Malacoplasma muris]|uniref:hypothetical protein n=1 Tax=Malacoplasma muris TaxID=2119 RepID=UPI00398EDF3F